VVGVTRTWEAFWKYYITFFVTYVAASGFGDILSISVRNIELINQLFPVFVIPLFMASGFIAIVRNMVFYFIGISYLSFFKFSLQAGIIIEFPAERVALFKQVCTYKPSGCLKSSCSISTPNLPQCNPFGVYDFIETSYGLNIILLAIQAVVFRIVAAIIWCKFTSDSPIPYSAMPSKESFNDPANKGEALKFLLSDISKKDFLEEVAINKIVPLKVDGEI
jgi:ABC-2 type transporter